MRRLWFLLVFMAFASTVQAQPITSATLRIYQDASTTLVGTPFTIQKTAITCGLTTQPAQNTVNSNGIAVNDPNNPGQFCQWIDTGSGPFAALPFSATATYTATLTWNNAAGSSPEASRTVPFTHPGLVPSAPVGLRPVQSGS